MSNVSLVNFLGIQNEVLNYGFADGPQVYRTRIKGWINEAQFQIAREVEGPEFQETEKLKLVIEQNKYALPEDFLRIQDIYYPELNSRLRPTDLQQFDLVSPQHVSGPPELYTLYGKELWIFPKPTAEDELQVRYIKRPPALVSDEDIPLLNEDYWHLLVLYAVVRAFEAEDDYEAAQYFSNRYVKDLDAYATDVQERSTDRPRTINGTWLGTSYGGRGVF